MKLNEIIAKYGNQEVDESKIKEVLGVKENKVWKPEYNEYYFFFDYGGVFRDRFISNLDDKRRELGNCYRTCGEAEFARDKQIFLTKFERYLRENEDENIDYRNYTQNKYFLEFDYILREIRIQSRIWCGSQGTIYTTNILALKQFIKDNEEEIKKYMFGVK